MIRCNIRSLVGNNIRRLRERRLLTQLELAERSDLHRSYIGGVERGERNVTIGNLARIASALQVSPGEFFQSPE